MAGERKPKGRHAAGEAQDEYDGYVEHPRFGKRPHHTGLNPETDFGGSVYLHWHSPNECRIPNTAVVADLSHQTQATLPVTHYYDVKRQCRDCGKRFIFFAQEQKHWYEELNFPLEVDCVRCISCRKRQQGIAKKRERYEELFHIVSRSTDENLEMAECCLSLIEEGIFNRRQTEQVRKLLKTVVTINDETAQVRYDSLRNRLTAQETLNPAQ